MDLKIDQKSLSLQAYTRVKQLILENTLKTGEKIYQEKMAEKLGISRIPLIQALSILQKERLIDYKTGKGFSVKKISTKEFHELLDLRGTLEGLAVKIICANNNEPIKKQLLSFLKDFNKYYNEKNNKKYTEIDKKFHLYILEISNNSYLSHINEICNIIALTYIKDFKRDLAKSVKDHSNIINAIIEGNGKKAAELMESHFEKVKKYF